MLNIKKISKLQGLVFIEFLNASKIVSWKQIYDVIEL
jgi:hypothetical protein